jgi:hypothetical protein
MAETAPNHETPVNRDEPSRAVPEGGILQMKTVAANNGATKGHAEVPAAAERQPNSSSNDCKERLDATSVGTDEADVEKISPEAKDARGHTVVEVFFKRSHYSIYRAKFGDNESVAVQFSKDEDLAVKQQQDISGLLPLRNKLHFLAAHIGGRGRRNSGQAKSSQAADRCYFVQVADAFRLGLENNAPLAKEVLQGAIENAMSLLERHARLCYLRAAATAVFYVSTVWALLMAISYGAGEAGWPTLNSDVLQVATAIFSGAMGALLSVAAGIRSRTISLDGDPDANQMEAATRVTIGVISAAVLYLLFRENFFTVVNLMPDDNSDDLRAALLIGFAGGFLERLVPDLIEKTMNKANGKLDSPAGGRPAGVGH